MPKTNTTAALWLSTTALIAFSALSASIHEAAKVASVGQMIFWRSFIALLPIVVYMLVRGQMGPALRTKVPHKHIIRAGLGCVVMALNFTALGYLPVGLVTALMYLAPIFSIFAAMVFLREKPGAVVFFGVGMGFVGILLMLYPSLMGAELRSGTLIGVGAAVTMAAVNALSRVQVKDLTRTDPPASIALSFAVAASLFGLATAPFGWPVLDGWTFGLLICAGLMGGAGHILMMEAVARAPVSTLAAFEYTGIIWAFGFDVLLLGLVLDAWSVTGALVVVAAAALVAYGKGAFGSKAIAAQTGS